MKTAERHRLKGNEVASVLERSIEVWSTNRQRVLAGLAVVALAAVVAGGFLTWRARVTAQAGGLLASAMMLLEAPVTTPAAGQPPAPGTYATEEARIEAAIEKFLLAAETYPATEAGLLARYQAASLLVRLGKPADAATRFREVTELAPRSSIHHQMARLGQVNAEVQTAKYDEGIAALQELSGRQDGDVPPDAALMQLGRLYRLAGKTTEAQQTFRRLVDEYPQSQFLTDANRELDSLSFTRS